MVPKTPAISSKNSAFIDTKGGERTVGTPKTREKFSSSELAFWDEK